MASRAALLGVVGVLVASLLAQPARATILLFDQQRDAATQTVVGPTTSGGRVPDDYGDRVTSSLMAVSGGFFTYGDGGEGFTPNVVVDIFTSNAVPGDPGGRLWQTGYGDLVNAVFGEGPGIGGSDELFVRLSADSDYAVDLYGFDLAGFGADYTIAAVEVLAGPLALYSATNVLVEGNASGPGHTTFAFASPLSALELLIRLDLSNIAPGIQDNIAIDSIRFGQTPPGTVPEPALPVAAAVLVLGLALARARAR